MFYTAMEKLRTGVQRYQDAMIEHSNSVISSIKTLRFIALFVEIIFGVGVMLLIIGQSFWEFLGISFLGGFAWLLLWGNITSHIFNIEIDEININDYPILRDSMFITFILMLVLFYQYKWLHAQLEPRIILIVYKTIVPSILGYIVNMVTTIMLGHNEDA